MLMFFLFHFLLFLLFIFQWNAKQMEVRINTSNLATWSMAKQCYSMFLWHFFSSARSTSTHLLLSISSLLDITTYLVSLSPWYLFYCSLLLESYSLYTDNTSTSTLVSSMISMLPLVSKNKLQSKFVDVILLYWYGKWFSSQYSFPFTLYSRLDST